ncbi:hypothetical protein FH972_002376 [Carpinus fangiana]|uniref:Transmembrane protein n=1 Tax=Carpinus fangiana TaxID=176857 RepID=A0A5N6QEN4_9ROSI|nr:hypothetical protein FH972_002376 [Carpinus fangiana]
MYVWRRNVFITATIVMFLFLIFMAMPLEATRPLGGTKPKYGAKMASFSSNHHTPVPPSGPNPCTYIPTPVFTFKPDCTIVIITV